MTINIIGYIAAILTTSALLPQVIKSNKSKELKDISLKMYLLMLTGVLMWLLYGLLLNNMPMILANIVTAALAFRIIYLKVRYG